MIELKYPFDENQIRALKAGDAVSITGPVHTGRDKFHKWFADMWDNAKDLIDERERVKRLAEIREDVEYRAVVND